VGGVWRLRLLLLWIDRESEGRGEEEEEGRGGRREVERWVDCSKTCDGGLREG